MNRYRCFLLPYQPILVTKYRRKVITGALKEHLYNCTGDCFKECNCSIPQRNGEADPVHILFGAPLQMELTAFITAFKSGS